MLNLHSSVPASGEFSSRGSDVRVGFWALSDWHHLCLFSLYESSGRRYGKEVRMPVVEDRLSLLEVKMQEVGTTLARIEGTLASLVQMVVGLDQRVQKLDVRVATLDQKVTGIDERFTRLERRTDYLDNRFDKYFLWVVGLQATILIAIVGGLFGIVTKLIPNL